MSRAQAPVTVTAKRWIAITAVIGYTALFLYLLFFVGLSNLAEAIRNVNLSVYLLAIGAVIASITFHSLVWFNLLGRVNIKLSFRRTFVFYWLGIFVDNLIPGGWSGDLFKAYLLGREPGIDGGRAVASVVAKNMYEAIFNLANMVVGLILLLLNYSLAGAIFIGIGLIMFLLTVPLIILLIVSFRPSGAKKLIHKFIAGTKRLTRNRLNLSKYEPEANKLLDDYHEGMKILIENPRMLIRPMILSFFAWGFEVLTLYLVFVSLGFFVGADKVIIVRSIAGNVEAQGYAFAGYAQIITTALYTALGVLPAVAASVALLGGVVVFWLKTGISYLAFHCVVFANCANYVCNVVKGTPRKPHCD
ncbi:MAG: flippase-like domain-containing protein [Candidatus Bathyarchaeota archaeon]|nr:flippase-like domain-containing protein [Candidatus Bathyarchaeota archaeon]